MAEELNFTLRGMRYTAKAWGAADAPPVLALHGWLDNAASFDALAPLLTDFRVVAVDLAGHGTSDHFPPQAAYNIWDDIPELLLILDELGWQRCHLLCHSRGATVGFLLAAVAPERIHSLFLMEGLLPLRFVDEDPAKQLSRYVHDNIKRTLKTPPVYASIEDAVKARANKTHVSESVLYSLVKRGLKKHPNGWTWCNDTRLMGASAFKLGEHEKNSLLKAVKQPGLLLLASKGFAGFHEIQEQCALCPSLQILEMDGHHHLHMDEQANALAQHINDWWQNNPLPVKNNKQK